jgi:PBP1b-binding outer membrane lipoprotein LpoB
LNNFFLLIYKPNKELLINDLVHTEEAAERTSELSRRFQVNSNGSLKKVSSKFKRQPILKVLQLLTNANKQRLPLEPTVFLGPRSGWK